MDRFIPFTRQASKDDLTNKLAFYKHKHGLGLSGKLSSVLPPGSPPEIPDAIANFTYIRSLDISQNNLHALTPRLAQLQGNLYELNASHNLLTDVSEVALLTNLHTLDLSHNNLKPVHIAQLSTLVNLKEFNLSNNQLSHEDSQVPLSDSPSPEIQNADTQTFSPVKTPIPSLHPRKLSNGAVVPRSPLPSLPNASPQSSPRDNTTSDTLSSISENENTSTSDEPPTIELSPEEIAQPKDDIQLSPNVSNQEVPTPIPLILTSLSTPDTPRSTRSRSPSPSLPSTASSMTPSASPIPSPSHSPVPFARHTPLPLGHFIHLETLCLANNNLRVFPDLLSIISLVKLDLSNNKIVEIPSGIQTQLVNLKELNLQSNLIEKFPPMMKSLKKLLFDKNPLHPAFLYVSQTGDLLQHLQNQDTNNPFPRSSSDSALGLQTSPPPNVLRSYTPPPNGFLSRIFRKDYSNVDNTPTKPKQTASAPVTPNDSPRDTKPKDTLLPDAPTHSRTRSDASAHSKAQADARALLQSNLAQQDTPDTPTKKRAFSLPQSPANPPNSLLPTPALSPSSPSRELLSSSGAFGSPPTPLIFPMSPPLHGPTPNEIYQEFVKKLTQTQNIKSSIDSFVARIKSRSTEGGKAGLDAEDLQSALRDFVRNTHTTLTAHPLWRKTNPIELQEAELHLQEYVLEHLYDHIFAARQEDKDKDKEIAQHIKRCYFITPEHLDIPVIREHEDIWRRAEQQLLQINSTRSVRSKMRCVVRMCRDLISSLARAHGDSLGADVLLPHLIYVILHANPPHLHSNIVYMTRFSESEASETIYYVTQLVAALYFIEHVEASSLNMDPEEFKRRMNEPYRAGIATVPSKSRLSLSGSAFISLDSLALSKTIEAKRKDFASETKLGPSEASKWIADNEALVNQCVGLSREVLPALPVSQTSLSTVPPSIIPPPRFEGVKLEDLRAVDIPTLLEDYQRLVSLLQSQSQSSPSSLPSLYAHSSSHSSNSLSSMTSNSTSSAPPSPLISHSASSSPSHSPSLISFNSP